MDNELCTRALTKADAAAVIGVLAVLQGHALAGELDDRLTSKLSARLGGTGHADLEAALDRLNQRVRVALGEYGEPSAG